MEYSYKFRIYPNRYQENLIQRTFGCCRFVFNHFLAERMEQYRQTKKAPTRFQQDKSLTLLKKELEWLREVDAAALQASLQSLDTAYQNFFRRVKQGQKPGYPRFKSKHNHQRSYKSKCVGTNIKVLDKAVQLPKLSLVKCRISKEVKGRILSATVSQNPSGKYFVSLCCTDTEIAPLPSTGAAVGLDMGLKAFAITSDGAKYPNHKYLAKSQNKLAKLQRKLSRKSKGSNRREKARVKAARLHECVSNQRSDMLHKLSGHRCPFLSILPALLCLRHSVARYKGPVRPGMDLPCLRYCPRPGRKRRKEHLAGRSAPVDVAGTYGRAGHARTYTLGDTV